jgi:hypothetical protein
MEQVFRVSCFTIGPSLYVPQMPRGVNLFINLVLMLSRFYLSQMYDGPATSSFLHISWIVLHDLRGLHALYSQLQYRRRESVLGSF